MLRHRLALLYIPVVGALVGARAAGWLSSDSCTLLNLLALLALAVALFGKQITAVAAVILALVVVPALHLIRLESGPLLSIEMVAQLGRFLCFAIAALGIDLIWGYTGILSLCQAMFFCLGGYCMGMYLALHGPLDGEGIPRCLYVVSSDVGGFALPWFWEPFKSLSVTLALGLLVPSVVAYIFGYMAFRSRVKGVYFSIITQATTLGAWLIFCRNSMRLCGTNGLTNFVDIAGFNLALPSTKLGLYVLTVVALVATYLVCRYVVNSRLGRILVAIRDNENRLRFAGYKPLYFKLFVFTLAAGIAGLGGVLYSPQMGIITPANMGVAESIMMVIWVAFGGRGTLSGAIVGALVVNYLYNILTTQAPSTWPFVQGALFIAVVLYFPNGLVGLWHGAESEEGAEPSIEPSNATASAALRALPSKRTEVKA